MNDLVPEHKALTSLGRQIEPHWRRHRPKMVAELEKAGKLRESVYAA